MPEWNGMQVRHRLVCGPTQYEWIVDCGAAAAAVPWVARDPGLLEADLQGMGRYFPHWVLVGSRAPRRNGLALRPVRCRRCGALIVPAAGAMRCGCCGACGLADGLMWIGHLPALARPGPAFARRRAALRAAGFAEVEVGGLTYMLVPLMVAYPAEWPNVEPLVRYAPGWLDLLKLPRNSAAHHLIQDGRACIFAWGQWITTPIHAVLQQRVVNHVASLLKVASGQRPEQAFIGRVHDRPWEPAQ
jgi:hypothetical protein